LSEFDETLQEIEAQLEDLPDYARYLRASGFGEGDPEKSIIVGAGDSLACAQFIERLLDFGPRSIDPYDLYLNPAISKGKSVYFLSASGRTKSNVESAKAVSGIASDTIAITANLESPLARICSRVLPLKFTKSPGLTPGTTSFTSSLLACYHLFSGKVPQLSKLNKFFAKAKQWTESQSENAETVHIVASDYLYPIAMYGTAKVFEFAGSKSDYQLTEEFSHVNLFSMKEGDLVVILSNGKDETAAKLSEELNKRGYCAQLLDLDEGNSTPLEIAICASIHMQYFALGMAQRSGLGKPAFLTNQNLLEISNRMIYYE
jgi:fructoselysine-6-P-deglycase FrlB-like protein